MGCTQQEPPLNVTEDDVDAAARHQAIHPLLMTPTNPAAWKMFPEWITRVVRFDQRYDPDNFARQPEVQRDLWRAFGSCDPEVLGILLLTTAGVVGHLYAGVETYRGAKSVMIYQWEKDIAAANNIDVICLQYIERWTQALGMKSIKALTLSSSRARLFRRLGFTTGVHAIRRDV